MILMNGLGISDVGKVRERNEDSFLIKSPYIAAVADGMGGHQGGLEASQLAIQIVDEMLTPELQPKEGQIESWVAKTVEFCNKKILEASHSDRNLIGMGTTLSVGYFLPNMMYWAHVGDSRIYLYRNGELKKITRDHALAGQEGKKSHMLTRALGIQESVRVDTGALPIFPKDKILISSDGLHDVVKAKEIESILQSFLKSPDDNLQKLVGLANNKGGGPDNITAILMWIE